MEWRTKVKKEKMTKRKSKRDGEDELRKSIRKRNAKDRQLVIMNA